MHYKNGREAKNGDMVLMIPSGSNSFPVVGILYGATQAMTFAMAKLWLQTSRCIMQI